MIVKLYEQVSVQAPKVEYDDIQSQSIDGNVLLLQDSSSLKQVEKFMVSMINNEKVQPLTSAIFSYFQIKMHWCSLKKISTVIN